MTPPSVDHWTYFAEFARNEMAVGGPDPHLVLVGEMSHDVSWEERLWRGGCYAAVYNTPTAEILWRQWPWPVLLQVSEAEVIVWLRDHWAGLATRRERRCIRTPEKLAHFLTDYAAWAVTQTYPAWQGQSYEGLWASAQQVYALYARPLRERLKLHCRAGGTGVL